jgi:hypothetical protein
VLCVIFCDVCYSVLRVIVVPLPPGINTLAVINTIYIKMKVSHTSTLLPYILPPPPQKPFRVTSFLKMYYQISLREPRLSGAMVIPNRFIQEMKSGRHADNTETS